MLKNIHTRTERFSQKPFSHPSHSSTKQSSNVLIFDENVVKFKVPRSAQTHVCV